MNYHNENIKDLAKWLFRCIEFLCPKELQEFLIGDYLEEYLDPLTKRRNLKLFSHLIYLFHPLLLKRRIRMINYLKLDLAINHLKVYWRSQHKNGVFSILNVLGLSLAIAFLIVTYTYVESQYNFDEFHSEGDQIYRVISKKHNAETLEQIGQATGITPVPVGPYLIDHVPVIDNYMRVASASGLVLHNNYPFSESISFFDPSFFTEFSFPILKGHRNALSEKTNIVLSEEKAQLFFGSENPIGQSLEVILNDSARTFVVGAVVDNKSQTSSLNFDVVVPFENLRSIVSDNSMTSFNIGFIETYLKIEESNLTSIKLSVNDALKSVGTERNNEVTQYDIQPLRDIHLAADIPGNASYLDPERLYIITGLAILVLVIAIINYLSLSTGHSITRLKEIGMRKALGAENKSIFRNLFLEVTMLTLFCAMMALGLVAVLKGFFHEVLDANFLQEISPLYVVYLLGFVVILALVVSGSQFGIISRLKTGEALRAQVLSVRQDRLSSKILVGIQLCFTVFLLAATYFINQQMSFIADKDLGFNNKGLIELQLPSSNDENKVWETVQLLKNEILENPDVQTVSASMNSFENPWTVLEFLQEDESTLGLGFNQVDHDYVQTMGLDILQGANWQKSENRETRKVLVNEKLVEFMGWTDPLNEQIPGKNFGTSHQIIGVVSDFNFSSLYSEVTPIILALDDSPVIDGVTGLSTWEWPPNLNYILVQANPENLTGTVSFLEGKWRKLFPKAPFEANHVEQLVTKKYEEELRWKKLTIAASVFAITIAIVGLLGIVRLSIQRRLKEMSIRRVLGSSLTSLIQLLAKEYAIIVLVALIIGLPFAYFYLDNWLNDFAYRIQQGVIDYILIISLVLGLTLGSVALIIIRATKNKPINILKE